MKKSLIIGLGSLCIGLSLMGCSRTARDIENVQDMVQGQVIEVEGSEDQYGWIPHMRLTFTDDLITEVYFDYVNDESEKKSQDEEYNSTMQEKTGSSAKDAMQDLRSQLIAKQNVEDINVIAGATQTTTEFVQLADKAIEHHKNGNHSANNYGEGDHIKTALQQNDETDKSQQESQSGEEASSKSQEDEKYFNGGDGNAAPSSSNS
ncbi:MAG: hypothetical protein ATN36_07235 [Epulopiscium sp. Nele67-Bin005]|nr:MAG: hypothetical protein ATN36_07235 [Epulopiscium sp. Nele67-Bin005]